MTNTENTQGTKKMKLKTAIKRIEKTGLKLTEEKNGQYWVYYGGETLAFYAVEDWENPEGDMVIDLINLTFTDQLKKDKNPMNGNCYTTYYENLKRAMESFIPSGKVA